jgi:putative ABC transport system permease protein
MTTSLIAGLVGLALSYPIVQLGLGKWLEENMGAFFPFFRLNPATAAVAVFLSILLGAVAATIPAIRASRLSVVDSLRRIV